MGTEESKAQVQHNGDTHIEIVNTQNEHFAKLDTIETTLWFVTAGVSLQLVLSLWALIQRRINSKVLKRADKLCKLNELATEK